MALAALWRGRNCFDQQPLGSWKVKIIVECNQKCCKIVLKAANVDFTGNTIREINIPRNSTLFQTTKLILLRHANPYDIPDT